MADIEQVNSPNTAPDLRGREADEPRAQAHVANAAGEQVAAKPSAEVIEFPRSRPVAQQGMHPGEVELF